MLEPVAEMLAVIPAHRFLADRAGDGGDAGLERGAPLRRVETAVLGLAQPKHIDERPRAREDLIGRLAPARTHEGVRVLPLGEHGKTQALARSQLRQREVNSAISGAPTGLVAVETKHRLPRPSAPVGRAA